MSVPLEAIQGGLYLKALKEEEAVALCAFDLALSIERKFGVTGDSVSSEAIKLCLKYFPTCPSALLHRAKRGSEQLLRKCDEK